MRTALAPQQEGSVPHPAASSALPAGLLTQNVPPRQQARVATQPAAPAQHIPVNVQPTDPIQQPNQPSTFATAASPAPVFDDGDIDLLQALADFDPGEPIGFGRLWIRVYRIDSPSLSVGMTW